MITAMTSFLILLAVLSIAGLWVLRLIETEDRGHRTPPRSHALDDQFLPPSARL